MGCNPVSMTSQHTYHHHSPLSHWDSARVSAQGLSWSRMWRKIGHSGREEATWRSRKRRWSKENNRNTKRGDARYFASVTSTSAPKPQSDIKTADPTVLDLQGFSRCFFDLQTAGTRLIMVVKNRKHIFIFVKYSVFITFGLKGQRIFSLQTVSNYLN